MTKACLALALLLISSVAHAGESGTGNARSTAPAKAAPAAPIKTISKANPCSEFGPGFAAVEGSSTCVRVGGALQIGASSSANH